MIFARGKVSVIRTCRNMTKSRSSVNLREIRTLQFIFRTYNNKISTVKFSAFSATDQTAWVLPVVSTKNIFIVSQTSLLKEKRTFHESPSPPGAASNFIKNSYGAPPSPNPPSTFDSAVTRACTCVRVCVCVCRCARVWADKIIVCNNS